ncbi:MAG: cyclic pyranopterin monophosphate synthase MoaC [Planctomycetes bacterium]|nr:cyclic pyranopterin monophosphate synthase MoaC [Planctomycetota bacterium]
MRLTHLTKKGAVKMVNVGFKKPTRRRAVVKGRVLMKPTTLRAITSDRIKKGNVLETAKIAGIMAAKETYKLIPLCHPLNVTNVKVVFKTVQPKTIKTLKSLPSAEIQIATTVEAIDRTGVEMEALVGTTIASLTIYDMCKAIDRGMVISDIKLMEKSGGRSGHYKRK